MARRHVKFGAVLLGLVVVIGLAVLNLRGLGVRALLLSGMDALLSSGKAVLNRNSVSGEGNFTNVVFLHHSTGRNLIHQGGVRERLTKAGFEFWDHDYNAHGLTRPDGSPAGYSYGVPGDNTDPDGLAEIFAQPVYGLPLNAFSGLLQHEVVVFKSCFPASNIATDDQLDEYKSYYLGMRAVMDQHRDKVFIVMTPPPLNPAATEAGVAARARAFANWLGSDDFLVGHPNVFAFDFFDLLAEGDTGDAESNMLRATYREGEDSHPNQLANETVGPRFADFIVGAVETYRARLAEEGEGS